MKNLLAYLQLLRLPNVFTAMADIFMGFLISHGSLRAWPDFLLLLGASSCIYLAGMVLNDWFDIEVDRRERPERPLPSGRVPSVHALVLGIGLLVAGLVAASLVGTDSRNVAFLLVAAVVAYDGILKHTLLGPMNMGLCRALNVLLGMSSVAGSIWLFDLARPQAWRFGTMVAAGIGLYIMGVTRFARHEAGTVSRTELTSTTIGFNLGLLLVAMAAQSTRVLGVFAGPSDPYWLSAGAAVDFSPTVRFATAALLWLAVVAATNTMVWRAIVTARPAMVQQAVKTCIFGLVGLDAAVVALINGPLWAVAVLGLLVPGLVLGRWVYST